jgi:hypothetical protein
MKDLSDTILRFQIRDLSTQRAFNYHRQDCK